MDLKLKEKTTVNKYVWITANKGNTEHVKLQNQKCENTKCQQLAVI